MASPGLLIINRPGILLNGWILSTGGVASGRVCACSLRSRLVNWYYIINSGRHLAIFQCLTKAKTETPRRQIFSPWRAEEMYIQCCNAAAHPTMEHFKNILVSSYHQSCFWSSCGLKICQANKCSTQCSLVFLSEKAFVRARIFKQKKNKKKNYAQILRFLV